MDAFFYSGYESVYENQFVDLRNGKVTSRMTWSTKKSANVSSLITSPCVWNTMAAVFFFFFLFPILVDVHPAS